MTIFTSFAEADYVFAFYRFSIKTNVLKSCIYKSTKIICHIIPVV